MRQTSTTQVRLSLGCVAICIALLASCSSGSNTSEVSSGETQPDATSTTTGESTINARLARLKSVVAGQIPVVVPNWNCDADDPGFQKLDIVTRLNSVTGDCVWSTDSSVIELDLFCGLAADRPCDQKLRALMESTNAFNSIDLAKMLVTRVLDGIQTSQDGFVTWSITDRGIRLIIDARQLVESGKFE